MQIRVINVSILLFNDFVYKFKCKLFVSKSCGSFNVVASKTIINWVLSLTKLKATQVLIHYSSVNLLSNYIYE